MRKHARTDGNHREIVEALRLSGAAVQSLATVGNGCPDLLVAFRGAWYVIEVKDGSKPPAHRRLTASEQAWHDTFSAHAPVYTVTSVDQALVAIGIVLDDDRWPSLTPPIVQRPPKVQQLV